MLDLRGNGGGLLSEAVLVSSQFIEDGLITFTKGRTRPRREFDAEGEAIDGDIPVVVLVDRGSASASEIVTGALRDSKRATVVGTRTFGKGVFQEVETLSNGGVLDITVGEYFLPNGENIHKKGVVPVGEGRGRSRDRPRRGSAHGAAHTRRKGRGTVSVRAQRRPARFDFPMVGVVRKQGRFLAAEPLFGPGGQKVALDDRRASVGDLVLVGAGKRGARVLRTLGKPWVARDVVEGLMLDRGLRRSFPRKVEAEAADGEPGRREAPRSDLRDLATFTDRSRRRQGLRRRHLGRAPRRLRASVGAHRRRVGLRSPRLGDRHGGGAPGDQRVRARRGRADAARGAVERARARCGPARTSWR